MRVQDSVLFDLSLLSVSADNRFLPCEASQAPQDGLPCRPKSVGSGSTSSSSSSSGRGSLSPVGYMCGPKRRATSGDLVGYMAPPGGLEEDDLDHGGGSQNLLRECALWSTCWQTKRCSDTTFLLTKYKYEY